MADDDDKILQDSVHNYISGESVVQVGGVQHNVIIAGRDVTSDDHVGRRQSFLFDFYGQALKQAGITFRMSLIFMSIGAVVVLVGAGLALMRGAHPGFNYAALLSGVSGVVIGSCGGAFALHANRARKHLTEQVEKIEKDLQADRRLQQTLSLIEQVDDRALRDRLKTVAAMRVLNFEPDAETVTNHLLANESEAPPKELG